MTQRAAEWADLLLDGLQLISRGSHIRVRTLLGDCGALGFSVMLHVLQLNGQGQPSQLLLQPLLLACMPLTSVRPVPFIVVMVTEDHCSTCMCECAQCRGHSSQTQKMIMGIGYATNKSPHASSSRTDKFC
jgi:hypothetical protein